MHLYILPSILPAAVLGDDSLDDDMIRAMLEFTRSSTRWAVGQLQSDAGMDPLGSLRFVAVGPEHKTTCITSSAIAGPDYVFVGWVDILQERIVPRVPDVLDQE